jgi:hypothetical protein
MTQRQYAMVIVIAAASGLLGGAVADWLLTSAPAWAQQRSRVKSLVTEELLLIDRSGRTRAGLGLDANGELGFVLTDKTGTRNIYLSPDESQSLRLRDKEGRVLWGAP